MAVVALLSNTRSTRLARLLPSIRSFIAAQTNIFHVEINHVGEVPDALALIARANPAVLVINGGDGTVQAVLTTLIHDRPFIAGIQPPLAILAYSAKTAIAHDYVNTGKPMRSLERVCALVRSGVLGKHLVDRKLIALDDGKRQRSVIGTSVQANCPGGPMRIIVCKNEVLQNSFASVEISAGYTDTAGIGTGGLHFVGVESGWLAALKTKLSRKMRGSRDMIINGVHRRCSDEIRLEGNKPGVKLDGEQFEAAAGSALLLRSTPLQQFVQLTV